MPRVEREPVECQITNAVASPNKRGNARRSKAFASVAVDIDFGDEAHFVISFARLDGKTIVAELRGAACVEFASMVAQAEQELENSWRQARKGRS